MWCSALPFKYLVNSLFRAQNSECELIWDWWHKINLSSPLLWVLLGFLSDNISTTMSHLSSKYCNGFPRSSNKIQTKKTECIAPNDLGPVVFSYLLFITLLQPYWAHCCLSTHHAYFLPRAYTFANLFTNKKLLTVIALAHSVMKFRTLLNVIS
jgi:hypothetical protein